MGRRRIPNEEICGRRRSQQRHDDRLRQHRPAKGKMGAREARRLIEEHGVKRASKFHPTVQGFALRQDGLADLRGDRRAPAAGDLPQRPPGHRLGHALRRRLRLQNSNPMLLEDVAIDFPDIQIVVAHPSWPVAGRALNWRCTSRTWDRPVGLEPEILFRPSWCSTPTRSEGPHAVRQRLPASSRRALDEEDSPRRGSSRRCTRRS